MDHPMTTMTMTTAELAEYLAVNPATRDALMYAMLGVDLATARAALTLTENVSRDAWKSVHQSSMSLSSQVSRYREARLYSDDWQGHASPGRCAGECDRHGI
jgi:hypothetical protein